MWILLDIEPLEMFLNAITDIRVQVAEVDDCVDLKFSPEELTSVCVFLMGLSRKIDAFEDELFYSSEQGFPINVWGLLGDIPYYLHGIASMHGGWLTDVEIVENGFIALRIDHGFPYIYW